MKSEGKVVGHGMLLPPHPDACQVCARKHDPAWPHDAQSIYYQMDFLNKNGRPPTWADAISHCPPEMQAEWKRLLTRDGHWSEPKVKKLDLTPEERAAHIIGGMPTENVEQKIKPGTAFEVRSFPIERRARKSRKKSAGSRK